jgi:hypothetical protein
MALKKILIMYNEMERADKEAVTVYFKVLP